MLHFERGVTRPWSPAGIHQGFGRYHQAVEIRSGARLLVTSGLLGIDAEGHVPKDCAAQCRIIFAAIDCTLREAGLGRSDLVHLRSYLVETADRPVYMAARDEFVVDPAPASTLLFVKALARPEFLVEIEAMAAGQ